MASSRARRRVSTQLLAVASLWTLSIASAQAAPPLIEAVRRGDLTVARSLATSTTVVNQPQADGATALHWAAHRDDRAMADLLLRAGADPNTANDLEVTPLWLACENASAAMVARLLDGGADPNRTTPAFRPMMMCARTGSVEAVKALIVRKADVNAREPLRRQTPLMWAAAQKHPEVVRLLIANGADVHARSDLTRVIVNRADPNNIYDAVVGPVSLGGGSALLFAARSGDVASARLLLAAGAKVDDLMADGTSALTVAAHSNHLPMVQLLLEAGANPNVIGSGYTALHAAVLRGNLDMVKALLARGANVDAQLRHGTPTLRGSRHYVLPDSLTGATPLWLAAKYLEIDTVRVLLERGARPAATLRDGTTPLMAAAGVGSQTKLFDRRDRASLLRDSDDGAALEMAQLLLTRGADVNATNAAGDTALHGAAAMNYPSLAQVLIDRGARADVRNKKGDSPLTVASGPEVTRALQPGATPGGRRPDR